MTETQKPSSSKRMSFPMSGWTLMINSSGQFVETMPLKSPVDFAKLRVSTVQEYLLIYLLCDDCGTQLADVFESFCNHIKGTHKLNPLSSMVLPASLTMPCSTNSRMIKSTLSC